MTNKPVKANKEIAELFWAFHRARLDDPSIKEMKPYIQPILDLITEARIDELKKVPEDEDYFTAIKIHPYIDKRIKALSEGRLE